jgi:predicted nucleotidyltransferase
MMSDLKDLFGSGARVKVLMRLLLDTRREFYQRELARLEDLRPRAVERELVRLARLKLVLTRRDGRRQFFRANAGHAFYRDLKGLFIRVALLGRILSESAWAARRKIELAFVFGSFAKGDEGPESDVDLFVVGKIREEDLDRILERSRLNTEREVNPMLYTPASFREELARPDSFLARVVAGPKIFLVGDEDDVRRLGEGAKTAASQGHP